MGYHTRGMGGQQSAGTDFSQIPTRHPAFASWRFGGPDPEFKLPSGLEVPVGGGGPSGAGGVGTGRAEGSLGGPHVSCLGRGSPSPASLSDRHAQETWAGVGTPPGCSVRQTDKLPIHVARGAA